MSITVHLFPIKLRFIINYRSPVTSPHCLDQGMRHVYIKPRSPQLNGKVERSHRSDQEEFYQLLTYKNDVDLNEKLEAWEHFYNFNRPNGAFDGKTPYEALRSILN